MKAINVFLLNILIYVNSVDAQIKLEDYVPVFIGLEKRGRSGYKPAFSLDFCQSIYFDSDTYYSCCFLKWTDVNDTKRYHCFPVNHTEMADIDII